MKNKFVYIISIVTILLISSCGSGLSEEEKNEIEKFDVEWSANIDFADYLYQEISQTKKEIIEKNEDTANDTLPDDTKTKYELSSITELNKIEDNYTSIKKVLVKENSDWMNIKQKAMRDEMEWEEVENEIEKKRSLLEKTKKKISSELKKVEKLKI